MRPADEVLAALAGEVRPFSDELVSMIVEHEKMMEAFHKAQTSRAPAPVVNMAAWRQSRGR